MHASEIRSEFWEAEILSVIKAWLWMIKQLPDAEITYLFIGQILCKDLPHEFSPTSLWWLPSLSPKALFLFIKASSAEQNSGTSLQENPRNNLKAMWKLNLVAGPRTTAKYKIIIGFRMSNANVQGRGQNWFGPVKRVLFIQCHHMMYKKNPNWTVILSWRKI